MSDNECKDTNGALRGNQDSLGCNTAHAKVVEGARQPSNTNRLQSRMNDMGLM